MPSKQVAAAICIVWAFIVGSMLVGVWWAINRILG